MSKAVPEIVFGVPVFRAGATVYAYDHLAFCVRKSRVHVVSIFDQNPDEDGTRHVKVMYNLKALDGEALSSVIAPRQTEPFQSPHIDETMVFATLGEALDDLKQRIEEIRKVRW